MLENLDRVELYKRLNSYFGIEYDVEDEKVEETLKQQDEKKASNSKRKGNVEYVYRKSILSKQRIETNRLAKAESEAKKKIKKYTYSSQKTMKSNIFQQKRGRQSQSTMEKR